MNLSMAHAVLQRVSAAYKDAVRSWLGCVGPKILHNPRMTLDWNFLAVFNLQRNFTVDIDGMAEYWKSTERYWCKHCACYVRDTKLERQNHESTAKHQGALKRFLRDLHRGHEREERDKERARREIARLDGVVSGSASSSSVATGAGFSSTPSSSKPLAPSESELKRQREQLAELGVEMPSTFRPEMAMPGQWTVTNTRVIETKTDDGEQKVEAKAMGVRKREVDENDKEEEEAMQQLFKKPRRWGRDSKTAPQEDDAELDALLSGPILTRRLPEDDVAPKEEEDADAKRGDKLNIKTEDASDKDAVKREPDLDDNSIAAPPKSEELGLDPTVKTEAGVEEAAAPPTVVFKKRKPKPIRQT
jgi:hypothetical protein